VRRVLIVCAVAAAVSVAFAVPQTEVSSASTALGPVPAVVVAQGISARSLAVGPEAALYVALATPQDRLFAVGASALASSQAPTSPLALVAGTGAVGFLGDGGAASSAQFSLSTNFLYERSGVAITKDGTIYVADSENGTIRRIAGPSSTEPGVIRSVAGKWAPRQNLTLSQPLGIALDRSGNLYIADRSEGTLDVLHADTGLLETIAQIASPASVAVTPDGNKVFVAAPEAGSVVEVDVPSRSVRPVTGLVVQTKASSQIATASACSAGSGRVCPAGLAVDGGANLFVSDLAGGRILRVDARTGDVNVAMSRLQQPGAIAFDELGRDLYVAEQGLDRVVKAAAMGSPSSSLSLSPSSWTFANEPVGGTSLQEQFTLTNTSTTAAATSVAITFQPTAPATMNDYTLESSSCVSTLAAGASCVINVAFTPTSMGALSSAMSAADASGDSATASLSGTGDDYQIQLATGQPLEVSVPQGGAAVYHLQIAAMGAFGQNGEQVSFVCPSGTPLHSVCTVSPASVTPTAAAPAAFTVTVQTSSTVTPAKFVLPAIGNGKWFVAPVGQLSLAALAATLGFPILLATRKRFRYLPVLGLATVAAFFLSGCHHQTIITEATPAGASNFLVQAAASSQNGTSLKATRGITLTIDVIKN
jgi:DNA-binding beta-propeller fold protein YncE